MADYKYTSKYKRYTKGNVLHHPPVPESFDKTSSPQPTPRMNTGDDPGPYQDGPRDPRLKYPRTIKNARKNGEGCSSCKWNTQCKLLYWHRNFGYFYHETKEEGALVIDPRMGRACESWNIDFPPLPPEAYDQDGLGVGNPLAEGSLPSSLYDPFAYKGQYGDMRFGLGSMWDSWNA